MERIGSVRLDAGNSICRWSLASYRNDEGRNHFPSQPWLERQGLNGIPIFAEGLKETSSSRNNDASSNGCGEEESVVVVGMLLLSVWDMFYTCIQTFLRKTHW